MGTGDRSGNVTESVDRHPRQFPNDNRKYSRKLEKWFAFCAYCVSTVRMCTFHRHLRNWWDCNQFESDDICEGEENPPSISLFSLSAEIHKCYIIEISLSSGIFLVVQSSVFGAQMRETKENKSFFSGLRESLD